MDNTIAPGPSQESARAQVERFINRFQPAYRALAYHAALPLILTPELLNYLHNQCLREAQVPWVAAADLLLSDLCTPVGYEQYAMDSAVRSYLLAQMEQELGKPRIQAIARLLIGYVQHLAKMTPNLGARERQAQQWAAMAYLNEHREQAVEQIVAAFQHCATAAASAITHIPIAQAELARLARITQELAPQLRDYPNLLEYAALIAQVLSDPTAIEPQALERTYEVLPGVDLHLPEELRRPAAETVSSFQPGSKTADGAAQQESSALPEAAPFPPLQSFEFDVATLASESAPAPDDELQPFPFTIVTVDATGQESERRQSQAYGFAEPLGSTLTLEMVSIPPGRFPMGSPESEPDRYSDESPQHSVTMPPFFLGKYPITQAQWRAVAALPQIERDLDSDPSQFKGDDRPVERVSWLEAVEFCARLSQASGREYRLPSEAEWEYACRAGTTTPFCFGETITVELANYDGTVIYGDGPKGLYRQETIPVGSFGVANNFGVFDMHGNVDEWCADPWHGNYESAPGDGSVWIENDNHFYVSRGGSWVKYPWNCRSAYRGRVNAGKGSSSRGFRVACSAA